MSGKQEKTSAKALFRILSAYIEVGELDDFEKRLAVNPDYDINTADSSNNSLFHVAMNSESDIKALNYLISLENISCTLVANKDKKTPIDLAIETKQLEKLTALLKFIYIKDKGQLPNLDAHLKTAITTNYAELAEICLLFGAKPEMADVENINEEKTLIVVCRFGYGIGANFKFDDAFKGNALPNTLCMVGATICGELLGSNKYLTAAIVSVDDLNASDRRVATLGDGEALLARLETDWSYWFVNIKNIVLIHEHIKINRFDLIKNVVENFNYTDSDRFFYLKDALNDKYLLNASVVLNDINKNYFPPLSLQRQSLDVIAQAVKNKKMKIEDVKFISKLGVPVLDLYMHIFNHPLVNLDTEKKNKLSGLLNGVGLAKAENSDFMVDFDGLMKDIFNILTNNSTLTTGSGLFQDDILQAIMVQFELFSKQLYSFDSSYLFSGLFFLATISGVAAVICGIFALASLAFKDNPAPYLYIALSGLSALLLSATLMIGEYFYKAYFKPIESQDKLVLIDALMKILGSMALHYKDERYDQAKQLADIAIKLSQPNRLSYSQAISLAGEANKILDDFFQSKLRLLPNNFRDTGFYPVEKNTFKLGFKLADLSVFAKEETRIQILPDEKTPLLQNS